ncbi:MAG: hypothetical protein MK008_05585 [Bdellovibrionales bacterium]|nr:hypothetical protein [Bdellovibrionales bacterium]
MFKNQITSLALVLAMALPLKADIIGAPILVVQAIGGIITFFASAKESRPSQLLTVNDSEIFVDSEAFKKKGLMLEKYLFYQCQNWDETKVIAQSEINIINRSLDEVYKIEEAKNVLKTKKHAAIFLLALNDFSNTHIRKSSFGGPFKKSQWTSNEFKKQLEHKGCESHQAFQEVKSWSDSHEFPFFK